MTRSQTLVVLPAAAALIMSFAAAAAFGMSNHGVKLDHRMEQACHREVKKRSPMGHRELRTLAYKLEEPNVGVAAGSLKSEFRPNRWPVNWTCRMHAGSGRILRVEFSWPHSGNRLKAISSSI